ncbi:hypothetical protein GCM10009719_31920 [Nocardioides kribbensis]
MTDPIPAPMEGIYPLGSNPASGVFGVHSGRMLVVGQDEQGADVELAAGEGSVWLDMNDGLTMRWRVDTPQRLQLEDVRLRLSRRGLGSVDVPATVTNSSGSGHIKPANLGRSENLSHVIVHWFNTPAILPSSPLALPNVTFAGRWVSEAAGWRLTFDQRADHTQATDQVRGTSRSVFTHVGKLERIDGSGFTADEADHVLSGWQVALSFATGRWVAPVLPVGYRPDGALAWEQWAPWYCSRYHGHFGFWDTHRSEDLNELCSKFMTHWLDPSLHAAARHTARHAICASSDDAMLEAKVSLAQSGIEYLAWVQNVIEGTSSATSYKGLPAHAKLNDMLSVAQVPLIIPPELEGLARLAPSNMQTGPLATTWLRNKLVHPKDAAQPYKIESALWSCWLLSLEYLELLLLHRLDYRGHYLPKRPHIWAHQSIPVPWA